MRVVCAAVHRERIAEAENCSLAFKVSPKQETQFTIEFFKAQKILILFLLLTTTNYFNGSPKARIPC